MKKAEMDNIMKEVDILLMDICDQYDDCTKCPFNLQYARVGIRNQYFKGTCASISLLRVYEINKGRIK